MQFLFEFLLILTFLRSLELNVRMCVLTGAYVSGCIRYLRSISQGRYDQNFGFKTAQNGKRLVPLCSFGEKQFKKHKSLK